MQANYLHRNCCLRGVCRGVDAARRQAKIDLGTGCFYSLEGSTTQTATAVATTSGQAW